MLDVIERNAVLGQLVETAKELGRVEVQLGFYPEERAVVEHHEALVDAIRAMRRQILDTF